MVWRGVWFQFHGFFTLRDCLVCLPLTAPILAIPTMRDGAFWVESQCFFKAILGPLPIPIGIHFDDAKCVMSLGQRSILLDSFLGSSSSFFIGGPLFHEHTRRRDVGLG